jgi:hypothetical protein
MCFQGWVGTMRYFRGGLSAYQNYLTEVAKKVPGMKRYSDAWYARKWLVSQMASTYAAGVIVLARGKR